MMDGLESLDDVLQPVEVFRIGHQHCAIRLVDLVGEARAFQRNIDRHLDGADLVAAEPGVQELGTVRQHDRDLVARLDADREQPVRHLVDAIVEIAQRERVVAELEGYVIRMLARLVLDDVRQYALVLAVLLHLESCVPTGRPLKLFVPTSH